MPGERYQRHGGGLVEVIVTAEEETDIVTERRCVVFRDLSDGTIRLRWLAGHTDWHLPTWDGEKWVTTFTRVNGGT